MDWIVIVDDDQENRARAASILRKENIKVTELLSGEELLNYLEGMTPFPDLILLDVKMPSLDGLSAARIIHEENLAGAIVMLTACSERDFTHSRSQTAGSPRVMSL